MLVTVGHALPGFGALGQKFLLLRAGFAKRQDAASTSGDPPVREFFDFRLAP